MAFLSGLYLCGAQTNVVVFDSVLSSSNTVLMTNAEFRCFSGNKVFFRNAAGYQWFRAHDLNTNVLLALHTTAAQLEARQDKINYQDWQFKKAQSNAQAESEKLFYSQTNIQSRIRYAPIRNDDRDWQQEIGNFLGQ